MIKMSSFQTLTSSKTNEHYTPVQYTNSARFVMGSIDLDPCSCAIAQQWIKAKNYYSLAKDGDSFNKRLYGNIWMNPPYGIASKAKGIYGASAWIMKVYKAYHAGEVKQAIILARGDSNGVKLLTKETVFCDSKRINFLNEYCEPGSAGVPGTRIFYLGDFVDRFATTFSKYGTILKAYEITAETLQKAIA